MTSLDIFRNQISQWVQPTNDEWNAFASKLNERHLSKDEIYLKEGDISRRIGFVTQGCLRMYYTINGEELCKDFQFEGDFTGSSASMATQQPSKFSIAALEDTTIVEISADDMRTLFDQFKVYERLGRLYMTRMFIYKEKREASLLFDSSTTRYENLVREQPTHAQRIPLKYLASYLGIKAESLSRIRKKIAMKSKTT
ncbi:MAG: Crp/Fnr family transcriptional regulator [Bacteroidota bacterium]